jgi:hypothetical protein
LVLACKLCAKRSTVKKDRVRTLVGVLTTEAVAIVYVAEVLTTMLPFAMEVARLSTSEIV